MATIEIGDIRIAMTLKDVKNTHLSVHPPAGRVTLVAPHGTRPEVARAYAVTKLGWIKDQRATLHAQARETPRRLVERESHYLWGRRHLLSIVETDARPRVSLDHRRLTLVVRPGSGVEKRRSVMHEWHKSLLHKTIPHIIAKWEPRIGVTVGGYFLQRMKTKWGSCNHETGTIRLNTELIKKPRDLLEYVIVHEMVHLIVRNHGERFVALISEHFPAWREARLELNELPLGTERWPEAG